MPFQSPKLNSCETQKPIIYRIQPKMDIQVNFSNLMKNWSYAALAQNLLNLVNMINAFNPPIMNEDKLDFKIMKNTRQTKFMESILKHGDVSISKIF